MTAADLRRMAEDAHAFAMDHYGNENAIRDYMLRGTIYTAAAEIVEAIERSRPAPAESPYESYMRVGGGKFRKHPENPPAPPSCHDEETWAGGERID